MHKSSDFMIAVEFYALNEKWEKLKHFACFPVQFTYTFLRERLPGTLHLFFGVLSIRPLPLSNTK